MPKIQSPVNCVAFLLICEGRFLAEKRKLTKRTDPGIVAIPGGHVEPMESLDTALFRELGEELGIIPRSTSFICSLEHNSQELMYINYYAINSWSGDIQNYEAESLAWISLNNPEILDLKTDRIAIAAYLHSTT